jgi:glycosyltransferase involved in cell wall biosynthesis
MRLLFAHDHRFTTGPAGELYTFGSFPASVWDRFLTHFDEVRVIARDGGAAADSARLARADRDRVSFEFLPNQSSLRQLVFRSPKANQRMTAAVESADVVVARLPSEIGLLAVRHARRLGKPYAVEVVGCAWDSSFTSGGPRGTLYAPLAYLRARHAIADAPFALYVTSAWLQQRYPTTGQTGTASNVDLVPPEPADVERREDRLARLAAGERPVLGTIGTLQVKYKGIQTAFAALARLRASGLDLSYRVLGPGRSEPWQRLADRLGIADLVHFDGTRRAGQDVCSWLDEIDIYLQPSFTEGLPRGMIEAMSRGAACLGSTRGGIPELLPASRLHAPGDVEGLARLIRQLASDPAAVAEASRADRETAGQFDATTLAERRSEFYARLRAEAEHGVHRAA